MEHAVAVGLQGKQGVILLLQRIIAIAKAIVITGGYLAKGTFGRGGVKWRNIDQVHFTGPKGFGTAKDLGNIKARLEMVQDQDEIMHPG